jgi:hypothetical protein
MLVLWFIYTIKLDALVHSDNRIIPHLMRGDSLFYDIHADSFPHGFRTRVYTEFEQYG